MEHVDAEYGELLDALAILRDLGIKDLTSLEWSHEQYSEYPSILVIILAHGIGTIDAIRILLEHGYGLRAKLLARSLIELEVDAALLSSGGQDTLDRYSAYEVWELAARSAAGLSFVDVESDQVVKGIEQRINDMRDALVALDVEGGDHLLDDLDLGAATTAYAKVVFDASFPTTWRPVMNRADLLHQVVPVIANAVEPTLESDSKEAFDALCSQFEREYHLAYGLTSAATHVSPRTISEAIQVDDDGVLIGFVIAGRLKEIPSSAWLAASHLLRLRSVVHAKIGLATDRADWDAAVAVTRDYRSHAGLAGGL
jgi:hypothetical protein